MALTKANFFPLYTCILNTEVVYASWNPLQVISIYSWENMRKYFVILSKKCVPCFLLCSLSALAKLVTLLNASRNHLLSFALGWRFAPLDRQHSFYTIEDLLLGWLNRSNKSFRRNSVFLLYIFGFWYIVKQKNRNFQSSKTSFYPMILWEKTLLLTNEQLQRVKTLKERTQWSCKQIPDLLRICLETNFWTFEGNICTKPDGNLIG